MEEGFHRGFFSRPYGRSFFFYIFTCVMSTFVFFLVVADLWLCPF